MTIVMLLMVFSCLQVWALPGVPGAPTYSLVTATSMRVTAPTLPTGATSMRLERKLTSQADTSYASIATGVMGGTVTDVSGLTVATSYTFRYVALSSGGNTNGTAAARSTGAQPSAPGAPTFNTVTSTSLKCVAPSLPANSTSLTLERKLQSEPATSYANAITNIGGGVTTDITTGLSANMAYSFRFTSVSGDAKTTGTAANVTTLLTPAAAPTYNTITDVSLNVVVPSLPSGATAIVLQRKTFGQPDSSYANITVSASSTKNVASLSPGTTYTFRFRLTGPGGPSDGLTSDVTTVSRPANDNFASAQVLTGASGSVTGTNVYATKETSEPNHWFTTTRSVWYRWTPTTTGEIFFKTEGSNFDTTMAAYTGTAVNALSQITANDDMNSPQSYIYFTATAGTTYRIAIDGINSSTTGNITLTWGEFIPAPDAPPSITATAGNSQVIVNWDTAPRATSYQVWRTDVYPPSAPSMLGTVMAPLTSYTDTTVVNGNTYEYSVIAANDQGESGPSPLAYAQPNSGFPAPSALRIDGAVAGGAVSPSIYWSASAGAVAYHIYRRTTSTNYGTAVGTVSSGATYWTDSSLPSGSTYFYVIKAENAVGALSPRSNELSIGTALPSAPVNFVITPGDTEATVTWDRVPEAASYWIKRIKYLTPTSSTFAYDGGDFYSDTPSFHDVGLVNGSRYRYFIRSMNSVGNSGGSYTTQFIPVANPATPTGVTAVASIVDGDQVQVAVSWSSAPATARYQVVRSTSPTGPYFPLETMATTTSQVDGTVAVGTTYYYKVQGYSPPVYLAYSDRYGPFSAAARVTTPPEGPSYSNVGETTANVHLPTLPAGGTTYTLYRATQSSAPPAAPEAGLAARYRADSLVAVAKGEGDGIDDWIDLSGNNMHAFADVPSSRPVLVKEALNGKPALRFNGRGDALRLPAGFNDFSAGLSAYVIFKPKTLGVSTRLFELANLAPFNEVSESLMMGNGYNYENRFGYFVANPESGNNVNVLEALVPDKFYMAGVVQGAGTPGTDTSSNLRLNGTSVVTGDVPLPVDALRTGNWIGDRVLHDRPFDGDIAEILIYKQTLGSTERDQLEHYLAQRYGLTATLNHIGATPTLTWAPIATNLTGGAIYQDAGLDAKKTYWYRVQTTVTDAGGLNPVSITGLASSATTLAEAPTSAPTPTFSNTNSTSTTVSSSPSLWPTEAEFLILQRKLASEPQGAYRTIGSLHDGGPTTSNITDLQSATSYAFRFVAITDSRSFIGTEATLTTPSATSGAGGGLLGTYYDNPDFTKRVTFRSDAVVNFDWRYLAPTLRMGADTFSVRWQGQIQPEFSEDYTFHTPIGPDESVRVWLNGTKIIDGTNYSGNLDSTTIALVAGQKYDIQIDYVEDYLVAGIKLEWESSSQARQVVPSQRLYAPTGTGTGLRGQYFNGYFFAHQAFSRTDAQLDFGFPEVGIDSRLDGSALSVLWTGQIKARYSQTYTFTLKRRGGTRLWINGVEKTLTLVNSEFTASAPLVAGTLTDIQVTYNCDPSQQVPHFELLWESSSQAPQTVPYYCLFPASSDAVPPTILGNSAENMGNTLPGTLTAGAATAATVSFKNRGSSTWTQGRFKLQQAYTYWGITTAPDGTRYWAQILFDAQNIELPNDVLPSDTVVIPVSVTAPSYTVGVIWFIIDTDKLYNERLVFESSYRSVKMSYLLSPPEVVKTEESMVRLKMPSLPSDATSFTLQRSASITAVAPSSVPSTDLSLWWRADSLSLENGSPVQFWKNTVDSNRANQPDITKAPVLVNSGPQGRPVVRFDGKDDFLPTNVTGPGGSAVTIFMASKASTAQNFQSIVRFEGDGGHVSYPWFYAGPAIRFIVANDPGGSSSSFGGGAYAGLYNDQWNIGCAQWASGQFGKTWRNGTLVDSWVANNTSLPDVPLTIGATPGGAELFSGDLAEILVYNRALNDTDRQTVERYLGQKYGKAGTGSGVPTPTGWTNIATGLSGGELYDDTAVTADTTYWYRVVAVGSSLAASEAALATTGTAPVAAPAAPDAPASGTPAEASIEVVAPGPNWPARATGLQLQMRLPEQVDADYADVGKLVEPDQTQTVVGLSSETTYRFRYVAVGEGGRTASASYAEYATTTLAPAKPDKPLLSDFRPEPASEYNKNQVTVTLPPLSARASEFRLEWNEDGGSTFTTVPEGDVVPATPYATPGSTDLTGENIIVVHNLNTFYFPYTFRVVAIGDGGETASDPVTVSASTVLPGMPPEPRISSVGPTWVNFLAPATLPINTTSLRLQMRQAYDENANWSFAAANIGANQSATASDLTRSGAYAFRWVAVGAGGQNAGPAVVVTLTDVLVMWRPGTRIECKGIRWPQSGATISAGATAKLASYVAVDFDSRDVLPEGAAINLMSTYKFTDACRYTWYCDNACITAGGGFPGTLGLAGTSLKQNPMFKAPTTPGTYTLSLVVDDAGGSIANGEGGARDDAAFGYNDDPLTFTVTFTVL